LRGLKEAWLSALALCLLPAVAAAANTFFEVPARMQILEASREPSTPQVTSGVLDSSFRTISDAQMQARGGAYWLRLQATVDPVVPGIPVLVVHEGRDHRVQMFQRTSGEAPIPLKQAVELAEYGGGHTSVFPLANADAVYAHVDAPLTGSRVLRFTGTTLDRVLYRGAVHARMIALSFGALFALALGSFLIWLVLSDKVFVLYAALISLQALYIAFLSGEGFHWPVLSLATPLQDYAWNVPVALSGAAASFFVREMTDVRQFSPRIYRVLGWFGIAFIVLTLANALKPLGLEDVVNTGGNVLFLASAIFVLVSCFRAWRHGSRSAGWFLLAWLLLEAATVATTVQLLITVGERGDLLLYSGLPFSMVAAAVLIALGVADRLRGQRIALTEAERRAQTDPLTGVLNRRSLIERLDAACTRARTRGLPISLLFIDLDHFKEINDTFGHAAGDACLSAIVGPIQSELRQSDVIGRYGGEEFVVILSSADAIAAQPIAERILRRVAAIRVEGHGEPISLTCSIGIATSDMLGVWGQHLLARADAAVYVAKRAGRNRVQFAEPMAA
jgi:diguanylate cyclase (GGDEF)-like protein